MCVGPAISSIDPPTVSAEGGMNVTFWGKNFVQGDFWVRYDTLIFIFLTHCVLVCVIVSLVKGEPRGEEEFREGERVHMKRSEDVCCQVFSSIWNQISSSCVSLRGARTAISSSTARLERLCLTKFSIQLQFFFFFDQFRPTDRLIIVVVAVSQAVSSERQHVYSGSFLSTEIVSSSLLISSRVVGWLAVFLPMTNLPGQARPLVTQVVLSFPLLLRPVES